MAIGDKSVGNGSDGPDDVDLLKKLVAEPGEAGTAAARTEGFVTGPQTVSDAKSRLLGPIETMSLTGVADKASEKIKIREAEAWKPQQMEFQTHKVESQPDGSRRLVFAGYNLDRVMSIAAAESANGPISFQWRETQFDLAKGTKESDLQQAYGEHNYKEAEAVRASWLETPEGRAARQVILDSGKQARMDQLVKELPVLAVVAKADVMPLVRALGEMASIDNSSAAKRAVEYPKREIGQLIERVLKFPAGGYDPTASSEQLGRNMIGRMAESLRRGESVGLFEESARKVEQQLALEYNPEKVRIANVVEEWTHPALDTLQSRTEIQADGTVRLYLSAPDIKYAAEIASRAARNQPISFQWNGEYQIDLQKGATEEQVLRAFHEATGVSPRLPAELAGKISIAPQTEHWDVAREQFTWSGPSPEGVLMKEGNPTRLSSDDIVRLAKAAEIQAKNGPVSIQTGWLQYDLKQGTTAAEILAAHEMSLEARLQAWRSSPEGQEKRRAQYAEAVRHGGQAGVDRLIREALPTAIAEAKTNPNRLIDVLNTISKIDNDWYGFNDIKVDRKAVGEALRSAGFLNSTGYELRDPRRGIALAMSASLDGKPIVMDVFSTISDMKQKELVADHATASVVMINELNRGGTWEDIYAEVRESGKMRLGQGEKSVAFGREDLDKWEKEGIPREFKEQMLAEADLLETRATQSQSSAHSAFWQEQAKALREAHAELKSNPKAAEQALISYLREHLETLKQEAADYGAKKAQPRVETEARPSRLGRVGAGMGIAVGVGVVGTLIAAWYVRNNNGIRKSQHVPLEK